MRKKLWIGLTATIVLVVLTAVTLFTMQSSNTKAQSADGDGIGVPKYWTPPQNSTVASILAQIAASKGQAKNASSSATIPFWSSSFTSNGTKFPYTMVGSDTAAGSATTTIQPIIVPLSLTFSNGVTLDGN